MNIFYKICAKVRKKITDLKKGNYYFQSLLSVPLLLFYDKSILSIKIHSKQDINEILI
jgi:hypothetical protein